MQDSDIKEIFSAIKMLKDKLDHVEKTEHEYLARIEELEKQVKEIQNGSLVPKESLKVAKAQTLPSGNSIEKKPAEVSKVSDPYAKENFIDRGDYYELSIPIGSIHAIEKRIKKERPYKMAKNYASQCRIGEFSDWRLPTIDELEVLCEKCPRMMRSIVGSVVGIASILSSSSCCVWYQESSFSIHDAPEYSGYYVFCVR